MTTKFCNIPKNIENSVCTYVVDARLGWPSEGWGGAEQADWQNSMHGFGPKKKKHNIGIVLKNCN